MEFSFTQEQQRFRDEVVDFFEEQVTPDLLRKVRLEGTEHAPELYAKLATRGWLGLDYPARYGGLDQDSLTMAIFREQVGYYNAPLMTHEVNNIIAHSILAIGDEAQKDWLIPRVTAGDIILCMGYSEPEHGSDLAGLKTKAVRAGDRYLVNGQKVFSTNAHIADYCFLAARTDPEAPKHRGISMFLVPMNTPGISVAPLWTMGGWRVNSVYFENVELAASARVGAENDGWKALAVALDIERSGLMYVGRARRILNELQSAIFGGGKVAGRGDTSAIADLDAEVRAGRLLAYRVAAMQSAGHIPNAEASMAKLFCSELANRVADSALRMLGPRSVLRYEQPSGESEGFFEEQLRWSLMGTIVAGTSEIQRTIIARRGLGLPRGDGS